MGLCLSKKQQQQRRQEQQPRSAAKKSGKDAGPLVPEVKKAPTTAKPAPSRKATVPRAEEPAADKRTVFVVKAAAAAAAAEVASGGESDGVKRAPPAPTAPVEEAAKPAVVSRVPVRTSSCTKEEVDAILIQCGRLSRSSSASGKAAASGESGGGHRRYSGSKRSYDFDRERRAGGVDDECDWDRLGGGAAASRPSPRRRTPDRKRSASHESRSGAGSGSRRVSRSPGRRGEGAPAAASSVGIERFARQPGKLVSVPAREKGRAPSPVKAAPAGKRYASPTLRSNSPARVAAVANENAGVPPTHGPSLSRSSSRKADNSPYRRNPMSELDENALANNHHTTNNGKPQNKKPIESVAAVSQRLGERCQITKDKAEIMEEAVASDTKAPSARMNATHTVSIVAESVVNNTRAGPGCRSSRRSSRDFDHSGSSFAFMEDAVAPDTRAPSSKINATHSVNIVAESVASTKAGPVGRSSRRSSRDFDHAFLNEAMASETKAPSSRMNATHTVSIVAESVANPKAGPAGRSSRRSSRDFDHNGNSYASLLLEDIQSYHQQNASDTAAAAPAFSLPACVSKACSILEAVADLNSSPSENRSFELDRSADDKGSANVSCYSAGKAAAAGTHVVESEVVVKDDLMEPSLHKYVSVRDIRGEAEPQESAGSNSFAGNPWTCSWEPNSVDSTDRTWTASQSNSDDAEQRSGGTVGTLEQSWQSKQESGVRPRLGSAGSAQLGHGAQRGGGGGGVARSDARTASANSSSA
ncbi:treacle protein-like [Triticum urartu]|nr:treacle protein-like [Triticum urartu]